MDSFKAIALKLISICLFVIVAALIRHLGQDYPSGQIAFLRALIGLLPVVVFYAWRGTLASGFRTKRIGGHFIRGSIAAIGAFVYIGALTRLPVVDVTAISFLAPLMMVVFAALFLGERVHIYRWSAVAVGFCGALLMLYPYLGLTAHEVTSATLVGVGFALLNVMCSAGATTQIRRLQETESTASIVIYFSLFVSLVGLATVPFFGWRMPQTPHEVVALVAMGFCGGIGQLLHTQSYRYASPSMLAPFEYSSMLWAFAIGYFFFGEVPTPYLIGGALIVTVAGLFVIWRERQLGLKRLRETPFEPAPAEADTLPEKPVKRN